MRTCWFIAGFIACLNIVIAMLNPHLFPLEVVLSLTALILLILYDIYKKVSKS